MGIKNKALLSVGLLIGLSIMFAVLVFAFVFQKSAMTESARNGQKKLENVSTHLDSYIDELSAIGNETNYNYYLQNYLAETKESDEETVNLKKGSTIQNYEMSTKFFSYALNNRTDVSSIMIFGKKKLLLFKSLYSYRNVLKDYSEYEWYQKAVAKPRDTIVTGPQVHEFLDGNTEKTLSLSRAISSHEDGSFMGVIVIDINLNQIEEICNASYSGEDSKFCILDEEGNAVYERTPIDGVEEAGAVITSQKPVKQPIKLGDDRYQMGSYKMDKTGWFLVSLTPASAITKSIHNTVLFLILTGVLLMLAVIIALNSILTKVVEPIIVLKKSMDEAEASNLNVRVQVIAKDETGMLAVSYNKMMDRIGSLMKQVVQEQEEKRKFELQALQAQINPHFLYNTLDSIIWMAEMKNDQVVPMTEALARLFRISLNKANEFITLENELEHVRNYLIIQSMRYRNKFDYDLVIMDEVRSYRTIKLIVQPIVENCIYHGIKKKKGKGSIQILAHQSEERVLIQITDDGAGMSQEACDSILNPDAKQENITGSGVGVRNVNERIRLSFGDAYGLHFASEEGQGTKVTITLPIRRA